MGLKSLWQFGCGRLIFMHARMRKRHLGVHVEAYIPTHGRANKQKCGQNNRHACKHDVDAQMVPSIHADVLIYPSLRLAFNLPSQPSAHI